MVRIGIDVGGTFTDFVVYDTNRKTIDTFKILSDPIDPAKTILAGLSRINLPQTYQIIHGSTVATNALLERKGAMTGLVTTYGFKDVLQIGRQNRPELYDWTVKPPLPLVPDELRTEVKERVNKDGEVLHTLDPTEVDQICAYLTGLDVESVAICFLFSFLYPAHEQYVADKLHRKGIFVSASSDLLPEFREFERMSTTVINAYVSPILDRYLSTLNKSLPGSNLQIMQSNGGMISLDQARVNGARCILSGPAGGIIGAQTVGHEINKEQSKDDGELLDRLITFDMGGTSTDVSLIDGNPGYTTEASIGGFPIHLPLLDIHTIGAGGGSIAYIDPGGALRVGPQSAGADPGPACYGFGDLPTVTDANLVLKRLLPDYFLGGEMMIDPTRAYTALEKLGSKLNLTAVQAAHGVIQVVNAQMERALRVISIERGHDPQDFSLLSFGGAGGLHAVELARQMNIPRVIVPKLASTLSAFGMLASEVIKDYVQTIMLPGTESLESLNLLFKPMIHKAKNELKLEGLANDKIEIAQSIDARYAGQSYELNIPFSDHFQHDFTQKHHSTYGYAYENKEIELVNLRVKAIGKIQTISLPETLSYNGQEVAHPARFLPVELGDNSSQLPVYIYDELIPNTVLVGPMLVASSDTTILISKKDIVFVDRYQNLLVEVQG